jgi:PAS domain S-box-containing protein
VVRGADGQRHVLESNRDVSDAKRAAERLRLMLDANPIGVLLKRADGLVIDANDAYLRIVGATREELVQGGVSTRDFTPPEHVPLDDAAVAEAHQRGISLLYEKEYVRRDGERVPVLVASAAIGGGEYVSFVLDITERKRADEAVRAANEQLRAADRRKDEFLGMLSHELRNPLAPIRNSVYLLQRGAAGDEQARHAMEVIRRQTEHLTRLVDDLLDVTRIASGKIELRLADVDLAELAARTADDHRAVMKHRDLALDVHTPRAPVFVRGDRTRLAQIVGNLLQNAAKFTNAGGRVTLSVAPAADGMAELSVRDTGIGIEPALLGHLFEPFTQAQQTLARSEGGLGLGLALVKGLAELHGGAVTAASGGMGQGSAFTVRLPLHAPRPRPVRGVVEAAPRARQQYRRVAGRAGEALRPSRRDRLRRAERRREGARVRAGRGALRHRAPGDGRVRGREGAARVARERRSAARRGERLRRRRGHPQGEGVRVRRARREAGGPGEDRAAAHLTAAAARRALRLSGNGVANPARSWLAR